jgi:hypothetical protein
MEKTLTRTEILKMPAGREIDALVAQMVFGWKYAAQLLFPPNDHPAMIEHWAANWDEHGNPNWLPHYSENISRAWEIVDEMCKRQFRYEVGGNFMGLGHIYAAFDNEQWADGNPPSKAFAETVPLAICRSALLTLTESI